MLFDMSALNAFISAAALDLLGATDKDGLTALHLACMLETVTDSVIPALIQAVSHLDSVTPSNQTSIESCVSKFSPQCLELISYYPLILTCLSARIIVEYQLSTETLPALFTHLLTFYANHLPKLTNISLFLSPPVKPAAFVYIY
ncbi:hypothetical protein LOD99_1966 [Oopsacas minuta]|uniref:Uncharacterized protein n=1 Tax=Oopsacas minuta TaxID=111878 RepID=A0AAV7K5E6_9METZ|nr:hypothetical protein LOD99_1933 [Oopsacas minuta]KAI6655825.1 hypothetical protein LOD99_1966 [Oopsacas minuta]